MRAIRNCWLIVPLIALLLPFSAMAQTQAQPKIVTFGADLAAEQRTALLQRFGATEGVDTILDVSTDEMRAAMQDIIPIPDGYTSVSSTALTCTAPNSGLRVSTENITRVSAAMYGSALVTAGVGDAELIVAAPAEAVAEGMTALTGVFKGLESGICGRGTLDPARRSLAYRQLVLTSDIADSAGGDLTTASTLLLRAQQELVRGGNNPDAVADIAQRVQGETGVTLPQAQFDALVQLLRDMALAKIDWGTYAAGWELQEVSATEVRITASGAAGATAQPSAATGQPAAGAAGRQITGTVASVAPLTITGADVPAQLAFDDPGIVVVRDGQPAQLSNLQPTDQVVVTLDSANRVQRIEATSAAGAAGGAAANAARTIQGTAASIANGTLTVDTAAGAENVALGTAPVEVRRNGQAAQLGDIQPGDSVSVQLGADGQPTRIEATGAQVGLLGRFNPLWCLPLLLIPLLLLLVRRRRKPNEVILVNPGHKTVVEEPDGSRSVVVDEQPTVTKIKPDDKA